MKNNIKPVLVGCEESGTLTTALRKKGIIAYSCDVLQTRGNRDWHFQDDIMNIIPRKNWRLIVLHPDCTALAVSGNRWYGKGKEFYMRRKKAILETVKMWELAKKYSECTALENPVSVIFKHLDCDMVQYVQPWMFGHGEVKKTGFALNNLNPLKPTKIVNGREDRIFKIGPGINRKRDRSKTYQGIADAIAEQWV